MSSELNHFWVPGPVIIGAGPSRLATAAFLKQQGVLLLILESESCLASLWKLKSYDHLRLHLPKTFCQIPYMVFLPDFPAYPTKEHFIDYLEMYAMHFSNEPIFEEEVKLAKYDSTICVWLVRANKTEYVCRWLIVATGENSEPVSPEIAQTSDFQGRVLHTSSYENWENFEEVKVLVVGCGNSGMEISLDLCNSGAQASVSVRDTLHILPREILGRSTSRFQCGCLSGFVQV